MTSLQLLKFRELHYDFEKGFSKIEWRAYHIKYFLLSKLIFNGLKMRAYNNFLFLHYNLKIKGTSISDPCTFLLLIYYRLMPVVAIKNNKAGKFSFRIPVPISFRQRLNLAFK